MPSPIPLLYKDTVAAGFLVSDGDRIWLVTCVHIFSGLINTPPEMRFFAGGSLTAMATGFVVPLFVNGQQRFSLAVLEPSKILADALALRLSSEEAAQLSKYGTYDIRSIVAAEVGQRVSASGFPRLGLLQLDELVVEADIEIVSGVSVVLSKPSANGMSGGPVVMGSRLIGLVAGDLAAPPAYTNAHVISLDVISKQLFE